MSTLQGYIRSSEFTEEEYISAFEGMLGRSRWRSGLTISRVSQIAENGLGYDGVLTSCVPLYIQFKRSSFCTQDFSGKTRKDRDSLGLPARQGFFTFNLHRDKTSSQFDQHNALWHLSRHYPAAYVAPLFFKRTQLEEYKQFSSLYPWGYEASDLHDPEDQLRYSRVERRFYRSITITPHREVLDNESSHCYTYDRDRESCFHSEPELLRENIYEASEFFRNAYRSARPLENLDEMTATIMKALPGLYGDNNLETFSRAVESCLVELDLQPRQPPRDIFDYIETTLSPSQIFLVAEIMLKRDFNIVQLLAQH